MSPVLRRSRRPLSPWRGREWRRQMFSCEGSVHTTVTSTVQKGHAHAADAGVSQVLGLSLPNSWRTALKHPALAAPLKAFSLEFPCHLPTHGWALCWADCDMQLTTLAPMWSLDMILCCFHPTLLSYGILFTGLRMLQDTPPTFHTQHQHRDLP